MPDSRLVDLAALGIPADDDVLYAVDISAAAPRDRQVTVEQLRHAVVAPPLGQGRVVTKTLAATSTGATPVTLLDINGIAIPTNFLTFERGSLTFRAVFTAVTVSIVAAVEVAGYELIGLVRHETGAPVLVGTPFRTTFGEDFDGTIAAQISGVTDRLEFVFTGVAGKTINVVAFTTLVYAQGDF